MSSIVFVVPSFAMGGAERVIVTLANGFARRGWDVNVAAPNVSGPLREDLARAVRVIDLRVTRVSHALFPLARLIARHPQAIVFSSMTHMNVLTLLAGRIARIRSTRIFVQEVALFSRGREAEPPVRGRVARALMRVCYRRAGAVFCISDAVAAEVSSRLGRNAPPVVTLPNPVNLDAVRRGAAAPAPHPWLASGARAQGPVLLGVGRLAPEKGFDVLLRALHELRGAGGRHRLILVGEGSERRALEALAIRLGLSRDVLAMVGTRGNPWAYMARADAVVVPSRSEGFGLVLPEAMACGTQVVGTRCGAPEQLLEGGRWGEIAPPEDAGALARAVVRALAARRDPAELKAVARRYDADAVVENYAARLATFSEEAGPGQARSHAGTPRCL